MSQHTLPPLQRDWLRQLSPDERAHSERLLALIVAEIERAGGWLDFQSFMNLALYAPGLGYYSAGTHKLGHGGDFTTAPEISPLFSRCVARQCAQVLQTLGAGSVLELGAGSGVMALEMLRELQRQDCLPERYCILEVSADLRARQQALLQQHLPDYLPRVHWLDALPQDFVGVIVANEVLDALPVQRFSVQQGELQAMGVINTGNGLDWQARPADRALSTALQAIRDNVKVIWPEGYCSEVNLQLPGWIHALANSLQQGVLLFIDYGLPQHQYYAGERSRGTLSCFFRQRMHEDPLINVGLQDITAWVDFTAVAEAGIAAGLELRGFATQAHFLFGAGLQHLLADMSEQDDALRWKLSQQVQKLTLPGEMGESFKAMALAKNYDEPLSGFGFRDLRDHL
ncbi:MAG: SAM-dependent methyltransferase [Steroidobacteraceae bacterium]